MLIWIFGKVQSNVVHVIEPDTSAGYLELERARVRWFLSVDEHNLPQNVAALGQRTFRSMTLEGKEIEFSAGFTDLHTLSYEEILKDNGFGLEDSRRSIETVYTIRNATPIGLKGKYHPLCKNLK